MSDHLPVLLGEVLRIFNPRGGERYLDATFGGGGHTRALLEAGPDIEVVAVDCDPEARERARPFESEFGERFRYYDLNFRDMEEVEEEDFDGVLMDLGLSSYQLEAAERGFSFLRAGPTDMRFDPRRGTSAGEFLERAEERNLIRAVRDFGEERNWRRLVQAILEARGTGILGATDRLAESVSKLVGKPRAHRRGVHPATRLFQGIRISVNGELENLKAALPKAFNMLMKHGVLAVISFHSLEDRLVKRYFRRLAGMSEHAGDSRPQQFREKRADLLTTRPKRPSEEEVRANPRSRSARLRSLRKRENDRT